MQPGPAARDDFHARYRLLRVTAAEGGIRTHSAVETATGRAVMVHVVDAAGPDQVGRIHAALGQLSETDKTRVLELATLPSGFAVVTEFIDGLTSFDAWLRARAAEGARLAAAGPVPAGADPMGPARVPPHENEAPRPRPAFRRLPLPPRPAAGARPGARSPEIPRPAPFVAPVPRDARTPIPTRLVVVIGVVVVLTLALVLYFVLRPTPPGAVAP